MTTLTKNNKATAQSQDTKIMTGITKNLASMKSITLNGTQYSLAQLTSVYQDDLDTIQATQAARAAWLQAVASEKASRAATALVTRALRSFLLANFGEGAVSILGDFGFTAPKSKATKSVATKALAAAKSAATREARGTRGSNQKKEVTGGVTGVTLTDTGTGAKIASTTTAGSTPAGTGSSSTTAPPNGAAPAAATVPTPAVTPGTSAKAS
jgi:hypothetical protein